MRLMTGRYAGNRNILHIRALIMGFKICIFSLVVMPDRNMGSVVVPGNSPPSLTADAVKKHYMFLFQGKV
jgi:hypothetical protein